MKGYLVLQGGSEFNGMMRRSDLRALELAGGPNAKVAIIPTAAAPDNNHERAGTNGLKWFQSLGANKVVVLPLIDRDSAEDATITAQLHRSRLIYLLGGFPGYLAQTLAGSAGWRAICQALDQSAVLAGSSAGAMVMCSHFYDPGRQQVCNGLGLLPNLCVLPHHDTFGHQWAQSLQKALPQTTLIGIDEQTGVINDGDSGRWTVYGGGVTLYQGVDKRIYTTGMTLTL